MNAVIDQLIEAPLTSPQLGALIACNMGDVGLSDFKFIVGFDDDRPWVQVAFFAKDNSPNSGVLPVEQRGRKWFVSPHMTRSEIARTLFMAVMAAVEHEVRELFTYRGEAVFGPHIDVDALHLIAANLDKRKD